MTPGVAVLYVPADNARALAKAPSTEATAFIFDLEDAVAPAAKADARETLRTTMPRADDRPRAIRINGVGSEHFTEDFLLVRKLMPEAIVLPKVERAADLATVETALAETDAPDTMHVWAMIETPLGVLNLPEIVACRGRLACLVLGANDLVAALGASGDGVRTHLRQCRTEIVLAARARGLFALDGVTNALRDEALVLADARHGAELGFDGKTLVHPAQIAPTLAAFRPTDERAREARAIVDAFAALPPGTGITTVDGRLVERLHLAAARRDLAKIGELP